MTTTYKVTLASSGKSFGAAADRPVLDAALAAGIHLSYSCRQGMCRTCRCKIESGSVDRGNPHPRYLSAEEVEKGEALLCIALPQSDLVIDAVEQNRLDGVETKDLAARVVGLTRLADDVMKVQLKLPMNQPLKFVAGQYLDFMLPDGERRSYSMANPPDMAGVIDIELHIRHMPNGKFSSHVFNGLKLRDMVRVHGPMGSFYLRENTKRPIIMVASGTGYAPIRSLIADAIANGYFKDRSATLYWGGRRASDLYLLEELQKQIADHATIRVVPVLSEPPDACGWSGRTGFVHRAVLVDFTDLSDHEVYACGAPIVVESARRDFTAMLGLPEDRFFADSFLTAADRAAAKAA